MLLHSVKTLCPELDLRLHMASFYWNQCIYWPAWQKTVFTVSQNSPQYRCSLTGGRAACMLNCFFMGDQWIKASILEYKVSYMNV
eukprot:731557-Karenia_brevis.AAC.1